MARRKNRTESALDTAFENNAYVELKYSNLGPQKRGVYARKPIHPGDVIGLFSPPLICVGFDNANANTPTNCTNVCQNCWRDLINTGQAIVKCRTCRYCRYCSRTCQREHWLRFHYEECSVIARASDGDPTGELGLSEMALIRMVALYSTDDVFADHIRSLTSHTENFLDHREWTKSFTVISRLVAEASEKPVQLVEMLFGTLLVNFINHLNKHNENIGYSFDPYFSLINHSCVPNTTIVPVSNNRFCLVATKPIGSKSQITTTYINPGLPRTLCQYELKTRYFFQCTCSSCCLTFDWFFSYNCCRCSHAIHSWDLATFHEISANDVFQGLPKRCRHCQTHISRKQFEEAFDAHRTMFLMLFDPDYNDDDLSTTIVPIRNYPHSNVLYALTQEHVDKLSTLMNVLDKSPMVPSYCYPLNIYVSSIADWYLGIRQTSLSIMVDWVIWEFKRIFGVVIPSDTSDLRFVCNFHYSALGDALLELACYVLDNGAVDTRFDVIDSSQQQQQQQQQPMLILDVAIKSAVFFYLQSLESYTRKAIDDNIREAARNIISKVNFVSRLDLSKADADLVVFSRMNPVSYQQAMFTKEVRCLFNMAVIPVTVNPKDYTFNMHFSHRERRSVFKSIDELDCKQYFS